MSLVDETQALLDDEDKKIRDAVEKIAKYTIKFYPKIKRVIVDHFSRPNIEGKEITYTFVVLTYQNNAIEVANITDTSLTASLHEFVDLLYGGHYSQVDMYHRLKSVEARPTQEQIDELLKFMMPEDVNLLTRAEAEKFLDKGDLE